MKVDQTDVINLAGASPPLIEEANMQLDAIFQYLQPLGIPRTDFTDTAEHIVHASRLGRLLDIFAELHLYAVWGRLVTDAIAEHGENATQAHVAHRFGLLVAGRLSRMATPQARPEYATVYLNTVTRQLAYAYTTCSRLDAADATVHMLCERAAPGLGMTPEEVYEALKAGNTDVQRVLGKAAMEDAEIRLAKQGIQIPANLRAMLANAVGGIMDDTTTPNSGHFDGGEVEPDMMRMLAGTGIDMSTLQAHGHGVFTATMPGAGGSGQAAEDHIKVAV